MYYWILIVFWQNEEESEENKKSSLKGLAGCTQINDQARIFIVDHKGSLQSDKISLIFVIFSILKVVNIKWFKCYINVKWWFALKNNCCICHLRKWQVMAESQSKFKYRKSKHVWIYIFCTFHIVYVLILMLYCFLYGSSFRSNIQIQNVHNLSLLLRT